MPVIGHIFAPNLGHTHPQGVYWDSLESFKPFCEVEVGKMLVLCTYFVHAASAIVLFVI